MIMAKQFFWNLEREKYIDLYLLVQNNTTTKNCYIKTYFKISNKSGISFMSIVISRSTIVF